MAMVGNLYFSLPVLGSLGSSIELIKCCCLGAFAVYLEPWHADIFEFLDLRKNHGKV